MGDEGIGAQLDHVDDEVGRERRDGTDSHDPAEPDAGDGGPLLRDVLGRGFLIELAAAEERIDLLQMLLLGLPLSRQHRQLLHREADITHGLPERRDVAEAVGQLAVEEIDARHPRQMVEEEVDELAAVANHGQRLPLPVLELRGADGVEPGEESPRPEALAAQPARHLPVLGPLSQLRAARAQQVPVRHLRRVLERLDQLVDPIPLGQKHHQPVQ